MSKNETLNQRKIIHFSFQDDSAEMDDDDTENDIFGGLSSISRHPSFKTSLSDRMNFVRGPQINIENLHLDLSTKHILMVKFLVQPSCDL
jgi:hypothetical protein